MNRLNRAKLRNHSPIILAIALLTLATWGCETKKHLPTTTATATTKATSNTNPTMLVLSKVELDQKRHALPKGIEEKDTIQYFKDSLAKAKHLEFQESGGQSIELDFISVGPDNPSPDSKSLHILNAQLNDSGVLRHYTVAQGGDGGSDSKKALVHSMIDNLVDAINQDRWVINQDAESILSMMRSREDSLMPAEAAIRAIRKVREIGKKDPSEKSVVTGAIRPYLDHPQPRVILAAAGALVLLKDRSSQTALIDAATTMGKSRDIHSYMTLITLMGDLGGEQTLKYLEIVSEGHQNPQVKQEAAKVLARIKNRPK